MYRNKRTFRENYNSNVGWRQAIIAANSALQKMHNIQIKYSIFKKYFTKFTLYIYLLEKGGPRIDEGVLLQRQIRDLGENQFKGNMAPLLQNLTKEIEFFERGDNKEDLHKLLNTYNSRRHPNIPYQVVTIIVRLRLTCLIIR